MSIIEKGAKMFKIFILDKRAGQFFFFIIIQFKFLKNRSGESDELGCKLVWP